MPCEQDYQNELMVALSATTLVRVWRQPAGSVPASRGGVVKCAPVGAADLTGLVIEGLSRGTRVEIECKGPRAPHTDEQKHWAAKMVEWGAVYVLARAKRDETLEAFAARATAEVLAAIDARAGGHGAR